MAEKTKTPKTEKTEKTEKKVVKSSYNKEAVGIDVSHWQGIIRWDQVKSSGKVNFAMIKAAGGDHGFYIDNRFYYNYASAGAHGINRGCYYFASSMFLGKAAGVKEALNFLSVIKDLKFEYPIALDIEAQHPRHKALITEAAIAFCKTLEKAGFYVVIYGSDIAGFKDRLDASKLADFDKWVARYGKEPATKCGIHQLSDRGSVKGIMTAVDLDKSFKDYPAIMKDKHLNGY